jgi:hypothetical protein
MLNVRFKYKLSAVISDGRKVPLSSRLSNTTGEENTKRM